PDESDVPFPDLVADAIQFALDVCGGYRVAVLPLMEVEHEPGPEEPVQRQLVDRAGGFATDRRVVVIRRIDVSRAVGPEQGEGVHGPALAVAEQRRPDPEHRFNLAR